MVVCSGVDISAFDVGLGKVSLEIVINSGAVCDLAGEGVDASGVIGRHSAGVSFDSEGQISGVRYGRGVTPGRVIKQLQNFVRRMRSGNFKNALNHFINNNISVVSTKTGVISVRE